MKVAPQDKIARTTARIPATLIPQESEIVASRAPASNLGSEHLVASGSSILSRFCLYQVIKPILEQVQSRGL